MDDFYLNKKGMTIRVVNNNIEAAISQLKRRMATEGVIKELRRRRYFEKPTTKRRREKAEAKIRWKRKLEILKENF
jgi:small subunit ribosomal protein S21